MFGKLPELFGRDFALGYLLPAAVLLAAGTGITDLFGTTRIYEQWNQLLSGTVAVDARSSFWIAVAVAALWAAAAALLALNIPIIRLLEGYDGWNPLNILMLWPLGRFDRLQREIAGVEDAIRNETEPDTRKALNRAYGGLLKRRAAEFPEARHLVLPTMFGNTVRAFERYADVVYGLDSIQAWGRLQAVIPADYRAALGEAKAEVDLWVNLWLAGVLVTLLYLAMAAHAGQAPEPWAPVAAALFALVAATWARRSAALWGVLVKGAFDLYRGALCQQLGFELPRSGQQERELWTLLSQAMLYRNAGSADALIKFRPLPRDDDT